MHERGVAVDHTTLNRWATRYSGPTPAAGAIVDAGTLDRIRNAGNDPTALLANNDSHKALTLSSDLLMTGATGTNVADIQVLLLGFDT